jgi:hypothetical protein
MATRSRLLSKSSSQSHSTRDSTQSIFSQDASSATTMDDQDSSLPYFSFPSSLPLRHCDRDREITQWIVAKDEISYEDPSYAQGSMYTAGSNASFLTNGLPNTTGVSWETAAPMDNYILDQCQPFMSNVPYQLSNASGSSNNGSQSLFDPLVIDPAINLSNAPYPAVNGLPIGMTDSSLKSDFASESVCYDSSSSVYMSPPVSPDLQGQHWPAMSSDYATKGDYVSNATAAFMFPNLGGFPQRLSSPPSSPISDGDSQAVLASSRQNSRDSQLASKYYAGDVASCTTSSSVGRHGYSDTTLNGTSARFSGSTVQSSTPSSRPAHRTLKPASEKPRGFEQGLPPATSPVAKPREKPETCQPRNHHLYKALPGDDGKYTCPFAEDSNCAHPPTKQKCGYE